MKTAATLSTKNAPAMPVLSSVIARLFSQSTKVKAQIMQTINRNGLNGSNGSQAMNPVARSCEQGYCGFAALISQFHGYEWDTRTPNIQGGNS